MRGETIRLGVCQSSSVGCFRKPHLQPLGGPRGAMPLHWDRSYWRAQDVCTASGDSSRLADVGHLEIQWVELRNAGAWVHEFSMFTNNLGCVGSERLRV